MHLRRGHENDAGTQPDRLRLEDHLCFTLYSTQHAIEKAYAPLLSRLGLTYPQYLVLVVMWEGSEMAVKELGRRLHLDSGTLTPLLKRLEGASLVARRRNPADERQVLVTLTESGLALRSETRDVPSAIACAMGQPVDELDGLRTSLVRLRASVARYLANSRTDAAISRPYTTGSAAGTT